MENYGWVRLHRKMFDNKLWLSSKFTKAQAWIDLFANANHEDGIFWIRGNEIRIKRGQLGWSELTMCRRWKWSRDKVRRYLKWLENDNNIRQQKTSLTTIITIVNYELYQSNDTPNNTADISKQDSRQDSRQDTNKNDKNVKNNKKDTSELRSPFVWSSYLEGMENHKRIDLQLIGYFFKRRGLSFGSKAEAEVAIRRHLRSAKEVSVFDKSKVFKAMDECDYLEKQKGIKWTLETVIKMLTK